ncbi:hypothetical protein PR001_g20696 [Phytophthora rubi]|uniref:Uncharacterized protein n=1 Tax=Phytophthora rubi TaxID=129364 RepID=A0A6A3JDK2_9STRA|nr:hypothetical protein PR001_g20696 [Phytophthora rubi]
MCALLRIFMTQLSRALIGPKGSKSSKSFFILESTNEDPKRLVCDLESKKSLCCGDDCPGVSEKVLNEYLAEHGPLTNPVFGKMRVFWIDEGYFVPGRDVAAVSWHP